MIGLVYKAYPDGCRHKYTYLPRLRPYPVRGHRLLCWSMTLLWVTQAKTESEVAKPYFCHQLEPMLTTYFRF